MGSTLKTSKLTIPSRKSRVPALCRVSSAPAQVVKLVDTLASGASGREAVEVQVLSWAPFSRQRLAVQDHTLRIFQELGWLDTLPRTKRSTATTRPIGFRHSIIDALFRFQQETALLRSTHSLNFETSFRGESLFLAITLSGTQAWFAYRRIGRVSVQFGASLAASRQTRHTFLEFIGGKLVFIPDKELNQLRVNKKLLAHIIGGMAGQAADTANFSCRPLRRAFYGFKHIQQPGYPSLFAGYRR